MENLNLPQLMYDWARDLPPKVIHRISPSQLGGCSRKHYYNILGAPATTPTNPGAVLNMQTGFMWESIIKDSLEKARVPFMYQYKMEDPDLNLEGTLDFGILHPRPDGTMELEIVDSKTESSLAARYRKGKSYFDAHEDYVHQLNCYALMALRQGFVVERGKFVVIHRDDSFIEEFPFAFDVSKMTATLEKIKQMGRWLSEGVVPPCDGKYCQIGLCEYGNPASRTTNGKGKQVNTECCPASMKELDQWRTT